MGKYEILTEDFNVRRLRKLDLVQLDKLACEIRDRIISVSKINGGHLASSLGAVEIAIALHYVFNTPDDEIIWDVGHQAYAHKIITGRNREFDTIRLKGGMSGFLKREESEYDVYNAGHTSTSVSAAAGLCIAREMDGRDNSIVAVIGDGALTGGVSFEGLNFIGSQNWDKVIIIVNDNHMSIDMNVGGLAKYYNRAITSNFYTGVRKEAQRLLKNLPAGKSIYELARRMEESIKNLIVKGAFYEDLGFTYIGPVDGHDLGSLIRFLKKTGDIRGPVLLHVKTKKGKGYAPAEQDPEKYHGISPRKKNEKHIETYTDIFAGQLIKLGEEDKRIVALTAAMPAGTGLNKFRERFPERYFDAGIAEQNAVILATAMALKGVKPFFAVYSTFLQRAFDQLIHDTAMMNAPVRFAIDRCGLVGQDGPTHHGAYDIAYLRMIPGMTVMAPRDGRDLKKMLIFMSRYDKGPSVVRYPRGEALKPFTPDSTSVKRGKGEVICNGSDVMIYAVGRMVKEAYLAAQILNDNGISAGVTDLRFIKPLDYELIKETADGCSRAVTVEFGCIKGGVGEDIAAFLNNDAAKASVLNIGPDDKFISHGGQDELMSDTGLEMKSIADRILQWIEKD